VSKLRLLLPTRLSSALEIDSEATGWAALPTDTLRLHRTSGRRILRPVSHHALPRCSRVLRQVEAVKQPLQS
jgi:hypothetical protein